MFRSRHRNMIVCHTVRTRIPRPRWECPPRSAFFSVALWSAAIFAHGPTALAQSTSPPLRLAGCFEPRVAEVGPADSATEYKYAIFVPKAYESDGEKKWPLLLFLHGSGECGTDGVRQTTIGLPREIERRADSFPFITVMPQAHARWFTGENEQAVWQMLDATATNYRVDLDRIYITGLSMGGFATWDFISKRPDVFAAAAPVCGVGDVNFIANAKHVPIWAFHGANDANVPVSGSRDPIQSLRTLGADPKYTEFADGDHYIWDRVYADSRLYDWMLEHKRAAPPARIEYRMSQGAAHVWWLRLRADPRAESPPIVSAEIVDGKVSMQSIGVVEWYLASSEPPLAPGAPIHLIWNNIPIYDGSFPGIIRVTPPRVILPSPNAAGSPTSRPADAEE